MKHLLKFDTEQDYEIAYATGEIIRPHVAVIKGGEVKYVKAYEPTPEADIPLYIEALADLTVKFSTNPTQYSLDNVTWVDLAAATATPTIAAGSRVYFRMSNATVSSGGSGKFTISGNCNIGGNIMSMAYGEDYIGKDIIPADYQFTQMFKSCPIVDASKLALPATTLTSYCYSTLFQSCTKLKNGPALPATTLADYCYQYMFYGCSALVNAADLLGVELKLLCYFQMFYGCSSLVDAPQILATNIASDATECCRQMFYNCTKLKHAPKLYSMNLAKQCYYYMFQYCNSLEYGPALPATTLQQGCYQDMFYSCPKLKVAPVLPALTLVSSCYKEMFYGCSQLSYVKAMFTTTPSTTYTSAWLGAVAASGVFVKNTAAKWTTTGENGVPSGWIIERADA